MAPAKTNDTHQLLVRILFCYNSEWWVNAIQTSNIWILRILNMSKKQKIKKNN